MDRVFKWLVLVLVAVEVALVRFGLLDLATAVGIVVAVEALLLLLVARQVIVAVRGFRLLRLLECSPPPSGGHRHSSPPRLLCGWADPILGDRPCRARGSTCTRNR